MDKWWHDPAQDAVKEAVLALIGYGLEVALDWAVDWLQSKSC